MKSPVWFTICCCALLILTSCGPDPASIQATTQASVGGTATAAAAAQSTSAAQQVESAKSTAAAQVQAAATSQAQAAATAAAQSTANAISQATAVAQAKATTAAQVQSTVTAQAQATAAAQATQQAKATATSKPAATTQPKPTVAPTSSQPATANDITNLRVKEVSPNELLIAVDYAYTGDKGNEIYIGVEATGEMKGVSTPWGFNKITKGRGSVVIQVLCAFPNGYVCRSGKTDTLYVKFLTGTTWELSFFERAFKYEKQWAPG